MALILWVSLQSVFVPEMLAGSYTHSITFDPSLLSISKSNFDGITYSEITYGDLISNDEVGHPKLPNNVVLVSVPNNSSGYKITSSGIISSTQTLSAPILPQIEDVQYGSDYVPVPTPDAAIYNSSLYYPTSYARIVGEQLIGGFNKVVAIDISPCRYAPKSGALRMYSKVTFTLSWTDGTAPAANIHVPTFEDRVTRRISELEARVVNPSSVRANANLVKDYFLPSQDKLGCEDDWFYLIVTTSKLAPAFERLAALRRMKGYPSHIITIEEVLANPKYKDGDLVSNVNDDAGKLRAFLTDAYVNHGTEYVLLAGRYPEMPVRTYERPESKKDPLTNKYITVYDTTTTDLYFGELTSCWVLDEKNSMTNMDKINYSRELHTGRLNCSTIDEVNIYIDKLITYEFDPGKGDPSYLGNAFVTISHQMEYEYDRYSKVYKKFFDNIEEHRQYSMNTPTPEEIISALNQDNWGFVDFRGHGRPEGISMNDNTWKSTDSEKFHYEALLALDGEDKKHTWNNQGRGRGLDLWGNKNFPNWSHSMSCSVNPLINYDEEPYTFAESYVLGENYGGIAFYGNTGPGYIGPSDKLQSIFFDEFYKVLSEKNHLPLVSYIGVLAENSFYIGGTTDKKLILHHTLQGDPLAQLWFKIPEYIEISDGEITSSIDNLIIGRVDLQSGVCSQEYGPNSNNLSVWNRTNSTNVLLGISSIPVILPTYILGPVRLASPHTVNMGDLIIGDSNASRTTLSWESNQKLQSFGNVSLANVLIQKEAIPEVQSSVLQISSESIELNEGTEIEAGAEVIFSVL